MKFDPIASVESCYANAADDEAWLAGILDGLAAFDQGPGLYAQMFHWADGAWLLERSVIKGAFPLEELAQVKDPVARTALKTTFHLRRYMPLYVFGTVWVLMIALLPSLSHSGSSSTLRSPLRCSRSCRRWLKTRPRPSSAWCCCRHPWWKR